MSAQIIEKNGKAEYAVVPIDEYKELLKIAEDVEDIKDIHSYYESLNQGEEELIPAEMVDRLRDESPIKVWREYRRMSQDELAIAVGLSQPYIGQLETGKREGKSSVLLDIAKALNLSIDDLVY